MQCKQIINIDWLSYSAYGIVGESTIFNRYKVIPKEHGSQVFKNLASIICVDNLEEVAQIQYNPRSSALKPNLCIIKIANRCLYEYDWINLIKTINSGLNLEYNSLSRLDICADFYTFKSINPHQLIREFMHKKLRRYGKSKYVLHGNQDRKQEYEYLRFGSSTSEVVTYLYNKSLEMREVKHKPYIVRQWSQLSYPFDDIAQTPDVWRLEFRLNGDNIKCLCDENAELHELNINALNTKETQLLLYSALVSKFWRWAKPTAQKFIDCQEVQMFDFSKTAFTIQERNDERQEVRKAKRYIKALEELAMLEDTEELQIIIAQTKLQLPEANKELQQDNKNKSFVSFIRHLFQAKDVLQYDTNAYNRVMEVVRLQYPEAYAKAKMWAERNGYRNSGDIF